jgi:hypothetical protein
MVGRLYCEDGTGNRLWLAREMLSIVGNLRSSCDRIFVLGEKEKNGIWLNSSLACWELSRSKRGTLPIQYLGS